jgi:hypothetical protein
MKHGQNGRNGQMQQSDWFFALNSKRSRIAKKAKGKGRAEGK